MPQSLSRIYLHLVFGTRHRTPSLGQELQGDLHRYIATVLANLGCHAVLINSTQDHVHVLFEIARTVPVSKVVEDLKSSSSRWLKTQSGANDTFAWQGGYGIFSVSVSNLEAVRAYVASQEAHHRECSFQEELRALLDRHGVSYDERYMWD